jgi:hypothetical protein
MVSAALLAGVAVGSGGCALERSGTLEQSCASDADCDDGDPCAVEACTQEGVCVVAKSEPDGPSAKLETPDDCCQVSCKDGKSDFRPAPDDHPAQSGCRVFSCSLESCAAPTAEDLVGGEPCKTDMGQPGTCGEKGCEPLKCETDAQCDDDDECTEDSCDTATGVCAPAKPLDFTLPNQEVGDCRLLVCQAGKKENVEDNTDYLPCFTCMAGTPVALPEGSVCDGEDGDPDDEYCTATQACVDCLVLDHCDSEVAALKSQLGLQDADAFCYTNTGAPKPGVCNKADGSCGIEFQTAGQPLPLASQKAGDCHLLTCDGQGGVSNAVDDSDLPDDVNECTFDYCTNGVPTNPGKPNTTVCGDVANGTYCNGAGLCGCGLNSHCNKLDTFCKDYSCNVAMAVCIPANVNENVDVPGMPPAHNCERVVCKSGLPTVVAEPITTVCRAATDTCDQAENCGGAGAPCPNDGVKPFTTICRLASGVCDVTEFCDGSTKACPSDQVQPTTVVCRLSAGVCDVAENCNGTAKTCPADAKLPSTTVCRMQMGVCDVAENCTGTSNNCPADAVASTATVCRPAVDVCDKTDNCDGVAKSCPADAKEPSTKECRAKTGVCDVAENCTGSSDACPADAVEPTTTVCRAAVDVCDVADKCDGAGKACPADLKAPSTYVCRPAVAGGCDIDEKCDGVADACPADVVEPPTKVCRASAGACDLEEKCTGSSNTCPSDAKSTAVCRASAGVCDPAESCNGTANDCPADAKSTAVCRASAGVCDPAESCDGASNDCPSDAKSTAVCRAKADVCDVAESCNGTSNDCPTDAFEPSTTVCRASAGACDLEEKCTGSSASCPADAKSTAVCRAKAGDCDVAESCNGTANDCPADGFIGMGLNSSPVATCGLTGPGGCCTGAGATTCSTSNCNNGQQCDHDGDCLSASYCSGGTTCAAKKANGETCTGGNECTSGNCTDGVCCMTSSCAICLSCNLNGMGTCSNVDAATADTSSGGPQCTGSTGCTPAAMQSCKCDGNGACTSQS